ncbi:MAG: OmpA family protein [Bacteroidales bacterium]|nr:OmpA family protein [Bacteroidales bacterium]
MKKIILIAALALGAMSAQAQVTVQGSKFSDNWSLGLKGGAVTPAKGHSFWQNCRGIFGLELKKQITPVFGLGVEGEATINTSSWTGVKSVTTIDHSYVGLFGTLNFMNMFAGYNGAPRVFEIEGVLGAGWLHSYYPESVTEDGNSWATKAGLNFNFNLGESKAWTISLKPAIVWNMNNLDIPVNNLGAEPQFNLNHAYIEMEAGVTYHFKNSNGTHSFKVVTPMDEELVAALNAEINSLRAQLNNCNADKAALQQKINDLEQKLADCLNKKPQVVEVVKNLDNVHYVFFNLASSTIQANQKPNIFMVAQQLKNDSNATVDIKGYASKDGSLEFNKKLAQKRAEAVKKALVKEGVAESRINAKGEGIGDMFSQNTWNRVAICTVEAK